MCYNIYMSSKRRHITLDTDTDKKFIKEKNKLGFRSVSGFVAFLFNFFIKNKDKK